MAPTHSKLLKRSPIKRASPPKNSSKLAKKPRFTLTVWGFAPLSLEFYIFRKGEDKDGFGLFYRQVIDGEKECPELEEAGFTMYYVRRLAQDNNNAMVGADEWTCYVYVRWVPGDIPSSRDTRAQGAEFLRQHFMDARYSRFPPNDILVIDETNEEVPKPMDHFLQDEIILQLMKNCVDKDALNTRFFTDYPELAELFFTGPPYYSVASMLYGFGTDMGPAPAAIPSIGNGNNGEAEETAAANSDSDEE